MAPGCHKGRSQTGLRPAVLRHGGGLWAVWALFSQPVGGVGALSPPSRGVGGPLTHGLRLSLEVGLNSGRFYGSSR